MGLIAVQIQRDAEKHQLDGEEGHEAVAPEGKFHETVAQETHGCVGAFPCGLSPPSVRQLRGARGIFCALG